MNVGLEKSRKFAIRIYNLYKIIQDCEEILKMLVASVKTILNNK